MTLPLPVEPTPIANQISIGRRRNESGNLFRFNSRVFQHKGLTPLAPGRATSQSDDLSVFLGGGYNGLQ
jgi:hypothetical protein